MGKMQRSECYSRWYIYLSQNLKILLKGLQKSCLFAKYYCACDVWDSHIIVAQDSSLLGCDTVFVGKQFPTFQRPQCLYHVDQAVQNDCLTLKVNALQSFGMLGTTYPLTQHHIRVNMIFTAVLTVAKDRKWTCQYMSHWLMSCFCCRFYLRRSHGSRRWVVFLEGQYVWICTKNQ